MKVSSRTPEGQPNHCPICAAEVCIEPTDPPGEAPCPNCGHLLWFPERSVNIVRFDDSANINAEELLQMGADLTQPRILLNLDGIEILSDQLMAKLVLLNKRTRDAQGRLKLCNLSPKMKEIFSRTRLDLVFETHADEREGLAAFGFLDDA